MDAVVHPDQASFDAIAHDRLAADPVRNTVALTSLHWARRHPDPNRPPTLITFHDRGELVGSVIRTPPWVVQTADLPLEALELAVDRLREVDPDLPGVTGPSEKSEAFATAWGRPFRVTMSTRLYRLGTLAPPAVAGSGRMATEDDVPLLAAWREAFAREASPNAPVQPAEEIMRSSLRLGNGHAVWEAGGTPVAWAAASAPIAGMTRVAPVYTPPGHRRHGYGAAVTAMITQWATDRGATAVVLFADLANPTSNSIYQRIGYAPVEDWTEHTWKR
ncbi:GNAT family N-acetyltransferase [Lentzea sp. NPDC042327]|uniref:GNAT family N-acetyltransferase n=1 Tax=Lentzea sp. NPDC042327 TaxID=3154801 RepID=UPI0033F933F5